MTQPCAWMTVTTGYLGTSVNPKAIFGEDHARAPGRTRTSDRLLRSYVGPYAGQTRESAGRWGARRLSYTVRYTLVRYFIWSRNSPSLSVARLRWSV